MLNMSSENIERICSQSQRIDVAEINNHIMELAKTMSDAKWSTQPRVLLELCIIKMATGLLQKSTMLAGTEQAVTPRNETTPVKSVSPMTENKPSVQKESTAAAGNSIQADVDKDRLWHAIFETGEAATASFNLIRVGTELMEVTGHTFTVMASSTVTAEYVKNKQRDLEDIMEQHTGIRRQLICKVKGTAGDPSQNESDIENIKKNAEKKLGINIELI